MAASPRHATHNWDSVSALRWVIMEALYEKLQMVSIHNAGSHPLLHFISNVGSCHTLNARIFDLFVNLDDRRWTLLCGDGWASDKVDRLFLQS